jgi:hypothetical protein
LDECELVEKEGFFETPLCNVAVDYRLNLIAEDFEDDVFTKSKQNTIFSSLEFK